MEYCLIRIKLRLLDIQEVNKAHRAPIPTTVVYAVVVLRSRNIALTLARKVAIELTAKAEAVNIVIPGLHALRDTLELGVCDDILEHIAEVDWICYKTGR